MQKLCHMLAYNFHDLAVIFIECLWSLCVCNLDGSIYLSTIVDNWAIYTIFDTFHPLHRIRLRHLLIHHEPINLWTEITCLFHISFQNWIKIQDHPIILIHRLNTLIKHAYHIVLISKLCGLE